MSATPDLPDTESGSGLCPIVTRRRFLVGLGATVVTAGVAGRTISVYQQNDGAVGGLGSGPSGTAPAPVLAGSQELTPIADRTLVVVEFGGGNDSLSMVVPHGDSSYFDLRGSLAIEQPLDLDGRIGLHPNLTTVADLYQSGDVAIFEGVGMPDPDLSHFESMQRWWAGNPGGDTTGWLGRYLDRTVGYDDLLAGITVGPGPSQAMLGGGSFVVNIQDASGLASGVPWWIDARDELLATWSFFVPVDVPMSELSPVQAAISATVRAHSDLEKGLIPLRNALESGKEEWKQGFADQLRLAASLITSGHQPKVIYVHGFGDFDTHDEQSGTHDEMMRSFDAGVSEFFRVLDASGMGDGAVIMTTSEFGRRPEQNGSGTDHGTAASHLVIGRPVAGGRYAEMPSLRQLNNEHNLIHTVDYRSYYGSVLEGWLGVDHSAILDKTWETLPLFG